MDARMTSEEGQALRQSVCEALGRELTPTDWIFAGGLLQALLAHDVPFDWLQPFEIDGYKYFGVGPGRLQRGWVGLTCGANDQLEWHAEVAGDREAGSWVARSDISVIAVTRDGIEAGFYELHDDYEHVFAVPLAGLLT